MWSTNKASDSSSTSTATFSSTATTVAMAATFPWAQLQPTNQFFDSFTLFEPTFMCGKDADCNYVLQPDVFPQEAFKQYSRRHFIIKRKVKTTEDDSLDSEAFIQDLSRNGTWLNNIRLNQFVDTPIVDNDVIYLVDPARGGFRFHTASHESHELVPKEISDKFIIRRLLNAGSSAKVYEAYNRTYQFNKVALKVLPKYKFKSQMSFCKEVSILRQLQHPCIIQIWDWFETPDSFIIVEELAMGRDLHFYVIQDWKNQTFDERCAKLQMLQVLNGLKYLHSRNICHRDIKLENILVTLRNKRSRLKLVDFGLSKHVHGFDRMMSFVGTTAYMAPEVIESTLTKKNYTVKADLWSAGCVLYSLLTGLGAFNHISEKQLESGILSGSFRPMEGPAWSSVTPRAKSLVAYLLRVPPADRPSAAEAMTHMWFTKDPEIVKDADKIISGQISVAPDRSSFTNPRRGMKRPWSEDGVALS